MENRGGGGGLHVVMFPWLAMGHFIPFLHLSKSLASRGHHVSFLSTPKNLSRLPKIPLHLSPLIDLITLTFPQTPNLPDQSESSMDIPHQKSQFLKIAFDSLKPQIADFLEKTSPRPDWIVYDYASHWLPPIASERGVAAAYFSLFNAANMAFIGPPSMLLKEEYARTTLEDFTVVPRWITVASDVVYRRHEVAKFMEGSEGNESGVSDLERFGVSVGESDVVLIRTCVEFEPDWYRIVCELYGNKPVVPVGFLPPILVSSEEREESDVRWVKIKSWLDNQRVNSVVYVAFGTEATLSQDELAGLAIGLEKSGLPFFWVLRKQTVSTRDELGMLPDGFLDQVKNRGIVYVEWAPQVEILGHPAIGSFLTHCGWNSLIEGLSFGRVPILFPVLNDQGLNARLLHGKKLGVEIPRNEWDGSFTSESVAESVRLATVGEEGESLRANVREAKGLFGDKIINDRYVESFVRYFVENRKSK
ncbi:UDP-glycosyltransferase [Actinidia chinensis var. chinensis]|uniref:UDP-glycosyltransferase n=1 Tax=Actinidia chinensis var. chinensis TaxID=1590841 RepID=A0A2R6RNL3_ACTCC|nr:UDP-glycosyltransferase [Actinidia chinensis var. chinensis]